MLDDINCKTFVSLLHEKKYTITNFASSNFHNFFNASEEKNFPTGPLASISLFFSIVKYARPDAPSDFAHLSKLSKKLLGLSFVFFVIIALTIDPDFTSFLKISNFTSSLSKILLDHFYF